MDKILYDHIGNNYNHTRQADELIANTIFNSLGKSDGKFLDVGCGTGNYTIAMAEKGLNMSGLEPSEKMLSKAKSRNENITWIQAAAEAIPTENETFNGIFGTLTLHHWTNIKTAFKELYRVLKVNSNIVFFTSTPEQMKSYWLNHYFPKMLEESILQMPSFNVVQNAATEAGFKVLAPEKYNIQDNLKDHFLYVGKNNPELYFQEKIRMGISSFADLANIEEVENELKRLDTDLKNGKFDIIKKAYENTNGDYLFFKAVKHTGT